MCWTHCQLHTTTAAGAQQTGSGLQGPAWTNSLLPGPVPPLASTAGRQSGQVRGASRRTRASAPQCKGAHAQGGPARRHRSVRAPPARRPDPGRRSPSRVPSIPRSPARSARRLSIPCPPPSPAVRCLPASQPLPQPSRPRCSTPGSSRRQCTRLFLPSTSRKKTLRQRRWRKPRPRDLRSWRGAGTRSGAALHKRRSRLLRMRSALHVAHHATPPRPDSRQEAGRAVRAESRVQAGRTPETRPPSPPFLGLVKMPRDLCC